MKRWQSPGIEKLVGERNLAENRGHTLAHQQGGDTFVQVNMEGSSGAEMTIRVDPLVAFQATDFLL